MKKILNHNWRSSGLPWLGLTVVILLVDQWSKGWACEALLNINRWSMSLNAETLLTAASQKISVMPHFDFRFACNTGAAFSIFANAGGWQRWMLGGLALIVAIVIVIWMARLHNKQKWLAIALSLILAGAIGNLADRLTIGCVIDFIDWYVALDGYHWPAFNIADASIFIGAVMLLIDGFWLSRQQEKQNNSMSG